MMYEISQEMRILAIKQENERRKQQNEKNCTLNSTSTPVQTLSQQEPGTVYRDEGDYREGFKWPHNKNYESRHN